MNENENVGENPLHMEIIQTEEYIYQLRNNILKSLFANKCLQAFISQLLK